MTIVVDARGLPCPQPVIKTRQAMRGDEPVVALVDSDGARANVSHMAEKAGWQVAVHSEGEQYRLKLSPPAIENPPHPEPMPVGRAEALSGPLVLVVSADGMGRGNEELGHILIRSFFHTLGEVSPRPERIILFNTGVRLACEGSEVLEDLCTLEASGIDILACGTCLGYFELKDKLAVGRVSNMYDIAETILQAGRVVNL
jgi:selenium metabolism protein YedF